MKPIILCLLLFRMRLKFKLKKQCEYCVGTAKIMMVVLK